MWVEETKNGKYKYCERYTDYLTGKEKKISVTLDKNTRQTWKTAQGILADRIAKAADQTAVKSYTLKEIVEEYRKDQVKNVKKSTYTRNEFAEDAILRILGKDTIADNLTAKYIKDRFLKTGKKPGTLNEHLRRFRPMMHWAYQSGMVKNVEFLDKLKNFRDTPHRIKIEDKFLEADEAKKLLDAMAQPVWRLVTQFMILSGMRIGEVLALERLDVDFQNKLIHVTKTLDLVNKVVTDPKTPCSIRDVYMQPELEACCHEINTRMLELRLVSRAKTSLFIFDKDGGFAHYYAYNKYLGEKSAEVLDHRITPHALRHTHASLLFENGINIDVISRRLGHENSKITREIYLHITERLKEKDHEIMKEISVM